MSTAQYFLVRCLPVGADADFNDERHFQFGDLAHQAGELGADFGEFVVGDFEQQFVMHLQNKAGFSG